MKKVWANAAPRSPEGPICSSVPLLPGGDTARGKEDRGDVMTETVDGTAKEAELAARGPLEWAAAKSASFDTITIVRGSDSGDVTIMLSREGEELPLVLCPPQEEAGCVVSNLFEMAEDHGY
jgi:hypothetical protein